MLRRDMARVIGPMLIILAATSQGQTLDNVNATNETSNSAGVPPEGDAASKTFFKSFNANVGVTSAAMLVLVLVVSVMYKPPSFIAGNPWITLDLAQMVYCLHFLQDHPEPVVDAFRENAQWAWGMPTFLRQFQHGTGLSGHPEGAFEDLIGIHDSFALSHMISTYCLFVFIFMILSIYKWIVETASCCTIDSEGYSVEEELLAANKMKDPKADPAWNRLITYESLAGDPSMVITSVIASFTRRMFRLTMLFITPFVVQSLNQGNLALTIAAVAFGVLSAYVVRTDASYVFATPLVEGLHPRARHVRVISIMAQVVTSVMVGVPFLPSGTRTKLVTGAYLIYGIHLGIQGISLESNPFEIKMYYNIEVSLTWLKVIVYAIAAFSSDFGMMSSLVILFVMCSIMLAQLGYSVKYLFLRIFRIWFIIKDEEEPLVGSEHATTQGTKKLSTKIVSFQRNLKGVLSSSKEPKKEPSIIRHPTLNPFIGPGNDDRKDDYDKTRDTRGISDEKEEGKKEGGNLLAFPLPKRPHSLEEQEDDVTAPISMTFEFPRDQESKQKETMQPLPKRFVTRLSFEHSRGRMNAGNEDGKGAQSIGLTFLREKKTGADDDSESNGDEELRLELGTEKVQIRVEPPPKD